MMTNFGPGPAGYEYSGNDPLSPGPRPGGLGRRFAARLIDGVLVNILAAVLSIFTFGDNYPFLVTGMFSGVLTFGYFVAFETTWGSSPAKRLLGLRVLGPGGAAKPTAAQSAVRNAFTLLAVVPYLGGLLAFAAYVMIAATINASAAKQGKHDRLAGGTQVVWG